MTSFKQIEANRRNARRSTGSTSEQGKLRSRRNAVRHGLTAETVIAALEDAEDYTAFEAAVIADYDALRGARALCCGWRACSGASAAPPPWRLACSRSRPGTCLNFGG